MNQPEILIVGAGGMGALFGSILHENGLEVYNFMDWFSIQKDGFKWRVSRTREVTEVLHLDRHQFPSF